MHINTSTLIYTVQGHVSIHYYQRSQEEDFVLTTELQTDCARALLICRSNNMADKENRLTTVGMWNHPAPSVIAAITSLKGAPSSG